MAYFEIGSALRRLAPVAAGLALLVSSAAMAEDAAPAAAAAAPAPAAGDNTPWTKTCGTGPDGKTQICNTSQELWLNQDGSVRASLGIQPKADKGKYGIGGFVPLGFIIPAGVVLAVDGQAKATAQFMQCNPPLQDLPPGCFISAEVGDDFIGALRKGNELALVVTNGNNQQLPIKMSLSGFAKSFDGEGIDPVALRAQQVEKSKQFQDAAKAAAQRMIDKQRQESGAPAN
ncbi:MAG TPA: invasion associated locus B family protein [Bauldia sp.]|nr:invasion associated locus B family protein [Bauldia sp.]